MRRFFLLVIISASSFLLSEETDSPRPSLTRKYMQRNWTSPKYMSGDWGGVRDLLESKGILITSSFVTECVGNPTGGATQGFTYTGSFGVNLDIDFEKACGITGFGFFISGAWRSGNSLTGEKIHNQFAVQEIFGGETAKLNELFFKETVKDWFEIKAGRLNALNDFLISPLYCQFLNLAFCGNPSSILYNTAITDYPFAEWGAYMHFKPFDMLTIKTGVYNGNTIVNQNKYHGFNFTFSSTNGAQWLTEAKFSFSRSSNFYSNYTVGFFYQVANTQIFADGVGSDPGYYFQIDQTIYDGLSSFLAMIFQPKDRNLMPFFVSSGLVWHGIVPDRQHDALSFGFAYGSYSPDLGTGQTFEALFEANYWIQVNQWLSVIPDFQWIIHPKGTNLPSAFCVGFQMGFVL